jgi:hypothetical protein
MGACKQSAPVPRGKGLAFRSIPEGFHPALQPQKVAQADEDVLFFGTKVRQQDVTHKTRLGPVNHSKQCIREAYNTVLYALPCPDYNMRICVFDVGHLLYMS